jgi:hypothetical protein
VLRRLVPAAPTHKRRAPRAGRRPRPRTWRGFGLRPGSAFVLITRVCRKSGSLGAIRPRERTCLFPFRGIKAEQLGWSDARGRRADDTDVSARLGARYDSGDPHLPAREQARQPSCDGVGNQRVSRARSRTAPTSCTVGCTNRPADAIEYTNVARAYVAAESMSFAWLEGTPNLICWCSRTETGVLEAPGTERATDRVRHRISA